MKIIQETLQTWRKDQLLQRVIKNSGYLFSSNSISMGLSVVQSIFAARLLGVSDFGLLGTVTVFGSTITRLFSFRMGELIIKYMGGFLAKQEQNKAGAVVKAAFLIEAVSSLLAFGILLLLSPFAAKLLADDPNTTNLFMIYGFMILGNMISETSVGILQVVNRFRGQAIINLTQSIITASIITIAFFSNGSLMMVLLAYLIGKLILGIGPAILALGSLNSTLGKDWWKASLKLLPSWKELARFGVTSNFSATINLIVRDSEALWLALFLSTTEVGYYKVALAVINLVLMPITPFISTTYPEMSRSVSEENWSQLKNLLRRVTKISGFWTAAVSVVLFMFGPLLILLYGIEYLPAYPAMIVLLVGFAIANVFFWNRPLLLSFGMPTYPFNVMLICGLIKVALAFVFVPRFGIIAEAALLSAYFAVSVGLIVRKGMKTLFQRERQISHEVVL